MLLVIFSTLLSLDFLNRPYFNPLLLQVICILPKVAKCVLKIKGEPILSKYVLVHRKFIICINDHIVFNLYPGLKQNNLHNVLEFFYWHNLPKNTKIDNDDSHESQAEKVSDVGLSSLFKTEKMRKV